MWSVACGWCFTRMLAPLLTPLCVRNDIIALSISCYDASPATESTKVWSACDHFEARVEERDGTACVAPISRRVFDSVSRPLATLDKQRSDGPATSRVDECTSRDGRRKKLSSPADTVRALRCRRDETEFHQNAPNVHPQKTDRPPHPLTYC